MKRISAVLAAAVALVLLDTSAGLHLGGSLAAPVTPGHYQASATDTWRSVATQLGVSESALTCANRTSTSSCPTATSLIGSGRIIHVPPVTGTTTTTSPATTTSTTVAPTTTSSTTSTSTSTTTTVPAPQFPTAASTGVPSGVTLTPWPYAWRSSTVTGLPTRVVNGHTYRVISGYLFDAGTSGNYFYADDPYVLFENCRFTTSGVVSNTSAMLQQASTSTHLLVQNCEFDGGPQHARGIQADYGLTVTGSEFTRFGNAAMEMNNRNGTGSLDAQGNYLYEPKGWNPSDHTDGMQVGGGKDVTIRNNTVLITPYGGADGDTSYVSNSALGLWAELGNVTGTVVVDHNLLGGGGVVMYLQQKSPYSWQGPVSVTNNVITRQFTPDGGIWGVLANLGLPAQLTWSGNTWNDGTPLPLADALSS